MKITFLLFLIFAAVSFSACQSATQTESAPNQSTKSETEIKQISVAEAKTAIEKPDVQFIDVRTIEEYASGHAPKAANYPLDDIEKSLAKLDKEKPVYVICQSGKRSQKASEILQKNGFRDVYNIQGGTSDWVKAGFPVEKN